MKMVKGLILLLVLLGVSPILGYHITVKNLTPYTIFVTAGSPGGLKGTPAMLKSGASDQASIIGTKDPIDGIYLSYVSPTTKAKIDLGLFNLPAYSLRSNAFITTKAPITNETVVSATDPASGITFYCVFP